MAVHPDDASRRAPLVVAHAISRLSVSGGVQIAVRGLARSIDRDDIELHLVSTRPPYERDHLEELPAAFHGLGFISGRTGPLDRLRLMVGVDREIRRVGAEVVHLHSGTAWLGLWSRLRPTGGRRRRPAFVIEIHDAPGSGHRSDGSHRFEGWCVRRLGMTALCHSTQVAEAVAASYRPRPELIRTFALGVDTDLFAPVAPEVASAWRADRGIAPGDVVAVAVGRGAQSKRFDLAIDAVARARELGAPIHLLVIGPGDRLDLAGHAASRGIAEHVEVMESLPRDELAVAIASCDVACSTSEYESFGLTIIEAMACGLPVLAMAVGGVTDLVDEGESGHLPPFGDVERFATLLVELAGDEPRRRRAGAAGRRLAVERFGMVANARHTAALYRDLAATRPGAAQERRARRR